MEDGDRFIVPPVPATVNVVGAVYDQNSFLFAPGKRASVYLQLAGGPNRDADRKHEFIIRADGEVVSRRLRKSRLGRQRVQQPAHQSRRYHRRPGEDIQALRVARRS